MKIEQVSKDCFTVFRTLGMIVMLAALVVPAIASAADAPRRPNIVIILGDDLGFADMGSFGSEIKTPNLDSLAKDGVRFANFYTHATCSPTRSILLTGVDTHLNGLGNMDEWAAPNQWGVDGYEGHYWLAMLTKKEQETNTNSVHSQKWCQKKVKVSFDAKVKKKRK